MGVSVVLAHMGFGEGGERGGQLQTAVFTVAFSVTWDDGDNVCLTEVLGGSPNRS